jgi:GNAT superfamily N-acetyltransferase
LLDGDELIAAIVVTHDSRKGWLNRLAVDPTRRRQGLASRLIRAAEEHLWEQGIRVIGVLIEDWNSASLALFAQAGYVDHPGVRYLSKRPGPEA